MCLLLGLAWTEVEKGWPGWRYGAVARPEVLFGWLAIPLLISGNWDVPRRVAEMKRAQRDFDGETAFLRGHAGPALCESLLLCAFAGKPYVYDPFNATRLIRAGKLEDEGVVGELRAGRFAVVQLDVPVKEQVGGRNDLSPGCWMRLRGNMGWRWRMRMRRFMCRGRLAVKGCFNLSTSPREAPISADEVVTSW